MRTALWVAVAAILVIVAVLTARDRPGSPRPGAAGSSGGAVLDEIRGDQIAAHLQFLADDLWDHFPLAKIGIPALSLSEPTEQFARPRLDSTR